MAQHQPRCPDAQAPGRQAARVMASHPEPGRSACRARENSEYVRRTLGERQPEFAALLESLEAELACPVCRAADAGRVSALRGT
jgi:hypothetical protein